MMVIIASLVFEGRRETSYQVVLKTIEQDKKKLRILRRNEQMLRI